MKSRLPLQRTSSLVRFLEPIYSKLYLCTDGLPLGRYTRLPRTILEYNVEYCLIWPSDEERQGRLCPSQLRLNPGLGIAAEARDRLL